MGERAFQKESIEKSQFWSMYQEQDHSNLAGALDLGRGFRAVWLGRLSLRSEGNVSSMVFRFGHASKSPGWPLNTHGVFDSGGLEG